MGAAQRKAVVAGPTRSSAPAHDPFADPGPLVERLSRCVVEVLLGVRSPEQLARWLDEPTYASLLSRTMSAQRMRQATKRRPPTRLDLHVQRVRHSRIGDAIEATAIITTSARGRAVAMRLEPVGTRLRATSLVVL